MAAGWPKFVIFATLFDKSSIDYARIKKLWALLKAFGNVPITQDVLYDSLKAYQSPADKVTRLVAAGFLRRIRRGLYCVSPDITSAPLALGLVANHLHGPSYVSFETELAFYGVKISNLFNKNGVKISNFIFSC